MLTACEKNENSSIATSDQPLEGSLEQTPILERDLQLDTVTKEAPGTDTQAIYSYKYYDDYIECRPILMQYRKSPYIFSAENNISMPSELMKFNSNAYATSLAVAQEIVDIFEKMIKNA